MRNKEEQDRVGDDLWFRECRKNCIEIRSETWTERSDAKIEETSLKIIEDGTRERQVYRPYATNRQSHFTISRPDYEYDERLARRNKYLRENGLPELKHRNVSEEIRDQDIAAAQMAIKEFNKTSPVKYVIEEVKGTQAILGSTLYLHCNFAARPEFTNGPPSLFFAELRATPTWTVTCVCLLVSGSCVRGCRRCSMEFVHPRTGYFGAI